MTNEEFRIDFIEKYVPRALYHYIHAKEKHPYFCEALLPEWMPAEERGKVITDTLRYIREDMKENGANMCGVLSEEDYEIFEAINNGDTAHAVDECYDAIAVLLRTIDVLEGRQKLGKPETKGETECPAVSSTPSARSSQVQSPRRLRSSPTPRSSRGLSGMKPKTTKHERN